METQARYLVVGSFVLILLLGTLAFVTWIGKNEFGTQNKIYDIYFQGSVTGLKEGAQVLYRGVPVGTVQSVIIDPKNIEKIRVRISLKETTPIRLDTQASLEMQGITGIAFVQLTGGSPSSPPLKKIPGEPYPIISSQPSKLQEIFEAIPKLLQNLNTLSHNLDTLISGTNTENFTTILQNLTTLTHTLANNGQTIEDLLNKADTAFQEIAETSKYYRAFAKNLEHQIAPLSKKAEDFFQESREFLNLNKEPLNAFLTSGLYEFSNALAELRRTLGSINRLTIEVERDPLEFFFGSGDQGYVLH